MLTREPLRAELLPRLARPPGWALAAVLAVVYLIIEPPTADHAAQVYRASLGLVLWDSGWYGGHHMPAYSVLFPLLASAIGVHLVAALAAVASAALFERLLHDRFDDTSARVGALWFALGTAAVLVSGRLTFMLGVAVGLAAVLAAERDRPAVAAALAALTALASPVAAAFVALAGAAWFVGDREHRVAALALGAAALAPVLLLTWAFPEGGTFPFVALSFWPSLAAVVAVAVAIPREHRVLRAGAVLYALAMVASFVLVTPMGGNAVRLGSLAAGPLLAAVLWRRNRRLLALLALPLLWFQCGAAVDDWASVHGDPSVRRPYYARLIAELGRRGGPEPAARLEVPFTGNHWETAWLAPHVPLARGWERQLDIARNGLFYDGRPLTAARYRRWLDANAVRWVAIADAPVDYSGAAEARLVRAGLPYLHEVWHDAHWRLFDVSRATPLAAGSARPTGVTMNGQEVRFRTTAPRGIVDLRVRFSPYWTLLTGRGCVERTPDDRVRLRLDRPGEVHLGMRFSLRRIGATGVRCTR